MQIWTPRKWDTKDANSDKGVILGQEGFTSSQYGIFNDQTVEVSSSVISDKTFDYLCSSTKGYIYLLGAH